MSRETGKATARRNLRTGTPVWLRNGAIRVPFGALRESIKVDVAVVGAGVTGALVADALLQAGKRIAVVDRRGPARGSTSASTALLQFELDQPLTHLSRKIGRARAARAYWRSAAAVGITHEIARTLPSRPRLWRTLATVAEDEAVGSANSFDARN